MSFLKKLGAAVLKGTAIVAGFAPMFVTSDQSAAVVNTVSADLAQISLVISEIEAVGQALNLKGPDKLIAAAPQVAQVILQSAMMAGKKIENEALFAAGSKKIADGMADVLNSLHESGVETVSKA